MPRPAVLVRDRGEVGARRDSIRAPFAYDAKRNYDLCHAQHAENSRQVIAMATSNPLKPATRGPVDPTAP